MLLLTAIVYAGSVLAAVGCGVAARYSPTLKRHLIGERPPGF